MTAGQSEVSIAAARRLLDLVHPQGNRFVLSAILRTGLRPRYVEHAEQAESIVRELAVIQEEQQGLGVYYSLSSYDTKPEKRGTEREVSRIGCAFADVDKPDKKQALARIDQYVARTGLAPSILIDTGAGYQALWLFHEPVEGGPFEAGKPSPNALRVRAINAALARELDGDHTIDLARVFRLPGTWNTKCNDPDKYPTYSEPLPCKIVEAQGDRRYSLEDLEALVTDADRQAAGREYAVAKVPVARAGLALNDADLVEQAKGAENGSKFDALWRGDASAYKSESEADEALLCILAFWTGKDPSRMESLFRASGLMREKWEREDYRSRSIQRAIELVGETYAAGGGNRHGAMCDAAAMDGVRALPGAIAREGAGAPASANLAGGLVLPSGDVTITATAGELFSRIGPTHKLFMRGGVVCRLVGNEVLGVLGPSAARSVLEGFGPLFAWRSGRNGGPVLKPSVLAEDMARALLESEAARRHLPPISGLVGCPVLFVDGSIAGLGYHPASGLYVTGGEMPPDVPLPEAVAALLQILREFDFQTPGDKARALASMLTPALKMGRHIKGNVPADVAESDKSQSGKTYRQKILAAIYNERLSLVTKRDGGVGSTDESFNAQLIAGRPFIQLDNFRGKYESAHIEAFLTAEGRFPARVPRCPEVEIDPSKFFVLLSSNGCEATRDFANRSNIIRIRKREGYKFRSWVGQEAGESLDLLEHVRSRQGYYLGCVFGVLHAWIAQGRSRTGETRHDFREWCQTLDWIGQNVCGQAPLMGGHQAAQERVSTPALTFLRSLALAVAEERRCGVRLIATQLYEIAEAAGVKIPGVEVPDEERGKRQIGGIMARLFGEKEDAIEVDGFQVTREELDTSRQGGGGNYVGKFYTFARSAQDAQGALTVEKDPHSPEDSKACAPCAVVRRANDGGPGAPGPEGEGAGRDLGDKTDL